MLKKCPYKYDLIASILTLAILVLSGKLERGDSVILHTIGVFLLLIAAIFWILPISHFKKYGSVEKGKPYFESSLLVSKGIYSIVRHPQYLAYMLLVSGFALLSQNWIIILLAVISIGFFFIHTIVEEKDLISRFGDDYLNYKDNVPRFNFIYGLIKKHFLSKSNKNSMP
jgi:protein-S-isoprenylcysteine O-methyltransferase Ste14